MSTESLTGVGPFAGLGIAELARRIRDGESTAVDLTEDALAAAHSWGKQLNCFVTVDDGGARRAARLADAELATGVDRGPLHGIPVGVKDMIATSGLATTMGSRHFAGDIPAQDASVVNSLRTAGAVILGKTQTHEFAYGPTSDRAATGAARNPQDLSRMTGGSSGGSAAAVAAGLVPLALGTDTGGSVRIPAALCGAVGLRPTQGSFDMTGAFPLSPTMDVAGPIAGSVADTALGWWALSTRPESSGAHWSRWSAPTVPEPGRLRGLRIGQPVCNLVDRVEQSARGAQQTAVDALAAAGAALTGLALPELDETSGPYYDIQSAEAYEIHEERVRCAPELFDPEVLERLEAAARVPGWRYVRALDARVRLRAAMLDKLAAVDLLLMPTVPLEAPAINQRDLAPNTGWSGVREALLALTSPWSLLGFPAISVPVPAAGAALFGSVQLVAKPGQERLLLDTAALLENSLLYRKNM